MISEAPTLHAYQIQKLCHTLAQNPLWVQGSGGNVSWKDETTLWVKASGMALADAERMPIFVPLARNLLAKHLSLEEFDHIPPALGPSELRPSIETWLHALMPQRIVVHLHCVEALVHLVDAHADALLRSRLGSGSDWHLLKYIKPGPELAQAVAHVLETKPHMDLIFLSNHGLVLGANTPELILARLEHLSRQLSCPPFVLARDVLPETTEHIAAALQQAGYLAVNDLELHALATDPGLLHRVTQAWALYPDHVVFLGDKAVLLETSATAAEIAHACRKRAPFIFVRHGGVFAYVHNHAHHVAQLRCYYDIVTRLTPESRPVSLAPEHIKALCNWEAEHHRQNMAHMS